VNGVSGALGANSGISAPTVTHCRVSTVTVTSPGNVTGIINGTHVSDCEVNNVGGTGPGTPTGINAVNVSGCDVNNVGNAASTGTVTGISGSAAVSHCTVTDLGDSTMAQAVTGITTQLASHCRVTQLNGLQNVNGIVADTAANCSAENLTQGAAATGSVVGISAARITDCRAGSLTGNGFLAVGFLSYRLASGCTASAITNGSSESDGFQSSLAAETIHCNVDGAGSTGIRGFAQCAVRNCTVRMTGSGIGIVTTTQAVIEGNSVASATTGIFVGATSLVVRNRLTLCTTNIAAGANSQTGPIVAATGTITSTNPWANFTD
jgi:hypothetical protein